MKNQMEIIFDATSINEGFARVAVAAFTTNLNPTMEEIADIKTAVSEAVTNAIIHGYDSLEGGKIHIKCKIEEDSLEVAIIDFGCGIPDVEQAMEPLYTTKGEMERSGMGFAFMEAFMDELSVETKLGIGTTIQMKKYIGRNTWSESEE